MNETSCSFDLPIKGKLTVCDNSKCHDFNAIIEYGKGKLVSSSKVDLSSSALSGQRFQSSLCFEYLGEEIDTNNITTSKPSITQLSLLIMNDNRPV